MQVIRIPKKGKKNEAKKKLKKIMAKNFPKLMTYIRSHIQEVQDRRTKKHFPKKEKKKKCTKVFHFQTAENKMADRLWTMPKEIH